MHFYYDRSSHIYVKSVAHDKPTREDCLLQHINEQYSLNISTGRNKLLVLTKNERARAKTNSLIKIDKYFMQF